MLVGLSRHYALKNSLLDIPNERSSHTVATPRGGGVGIALVALAAVAWCMFRGTVSVHFATGAIVAGAIVALVGWMDDHRDIPAQYRAAAQLGAVAWAMYWLGGYPGVDLGGVHLQLGWVGAAAAILAICWLINLYNFMDGTDGLAAVQGLTAGLMGAFLLGRQGDSGLSMVSLAVAGACGGFLIWNWQPAKIFMGDVGSYLLGMFFGLLAVAGENQQIIPALTWVILLSVFVWDATFTLLWRMVSGQRWHSAHKDHAYQRLTQLGYTHRQVAIGAALVNVVLLWPLAAVAVHRPSALLPITLATGGIMLALWWQIQRRYRMSNSE